jgi:Zn-dependent metalloprotease
MQQCYKRIGHLVLLSILMGSLSMAHARPVAQTDTFGSDNPLIARLDRETSGQVRIAYHAETGKVRFIGADLQHAIPRSAGLAASANPELVARAFLANYGALFGLTDQARDLTVMRAPVYAGQTFVRFQQRYQGIPVMGGELIVQVDGRRDVLAAKGEVLPNLNLNTTPRVSPETARERALALVAATYDLRQADLRASQPELWVFNPALLGGPGLRRSTLNWRLEVTNRGAGEPVREVVLVDAHRGGVNLHFNQIAYAKERHICDDQNVPDAANDQDARCSTAQPPGSLFVRDEGDAPTGVQDVDLAYDFSGITYDFFMNHFNRDSLDDAGMPLISLVRYCPVACPYENANWDGQQMTYGDGYASADDVVGHELAHGVTQFSSNLYYYFQAGAINESMSDVFGELIDLTDGRGDDSADVRWLMGEDLPIGAIRDMREPANSGQPDRTGSPLYVTDPSLGDVGGVHSNSGVSNKAAYLMVDGDTFNGYTIQSLGITRTAQIYYAANNGLLTSGSDYQDLGDALNQACASLVGQHGITAANCVEVSEVVKATEMDQVPPNAPAQDVALCPTGQTANNVFFDDLENLANKKWASAPVTGTLNRWFYPQDPVLDPIGGIYATSGVANFWGADYAVLPSDPGGPGSYAIAMTQSVALPANAFLHFNHAHDFARNAIQRFTGGVVEYSTNNGATWSDTAALYIGNGYNGTISSGTGNPLAGRKAFTSTSYGYQSSRLNLSTLGGQNVRFRFRIGTDTGPGLFGWYVDDVRIYTCGGTAGANVAPTVSPGAVNYTGGITVSRGGAAVSREIARVSDDRDLANNLTVSASGLPAGMTGTVTNSNGLVTLTINGGCAAAEGTYQITLSASDSGGLVGSATIPVTVEPAGQAVKDQSFEFGSPNPYWAETFFGSAALLCDTGSCVTSATAGPRTGVWWARFGSPVGISADGFVQQQITIPGSSPKLEFYLRISNHSGQGTADYVRLKIGATTVFTVTDATTSYDNVYKKVTIDLAPYANSTRVLRFEAHNEVAAAAFRVHVDDVTTTSTQSSCVGIFPTRAFLPVIRR